MTKKENIDKLIKKYGKDKIKILAALVATSMTLGFSGCGDKRKEVSDGMEGYDSINTNDIENSDKSLLSGGVHQVKDVMGEDFKLLIDYYTGEENWRITSNKKLYIEIKTQGLPDNLEVYIDNVHTDTSIVSSKPIFNGILQDTMDDRIHSSLVLGFPIDDNRSYFGINEIEGQNQQFLQGYFFGYKGYQTGEIEQKRYLESDYLANGVWANKIDSVIDLMIVDKNTKEVIRQVSVDSSILVEVNNYVTFQEGREYTEYKYEKDGSKTKVRTYKE